AGDRAAYWVPPSADSRVFYQRAYDRPSLMTRLVEAGPFELTDLTFWGERTLPVEDFLLSPKLPVAIRWAMLPAHFPLSRPFLSRRREDERCRKKVACLTLRKVDRS